MDLYLYNSGVYALIPNIFSQRHLTLRAGGCSFHCIFIEMHSCRAVSALCPAMAFYPGDPEKRF
jgi:hypothetical protein